MWRTRMVSGPYKNGGDVSASSPGDWQRISSNASAFLADPVAYRWKGPVEFEAAGTMYNGINIGGAVKKAYTVNNEPTGKALGHHFRDAAFVYMVDSKNPSRNNIRQLVKNELLILASNPNLDFTNSAKWPSHCFCPFVSRSSRCHWWFWVSRPTVSFTTQLAEAQGGEPGKEVRDGGREACVR